MIHSLRQIVFFATIIYVTMSDEVSIAQDFQGIFLRFYSGTTMNEYVDYNLGNASLLSSKIVDNKPTVMYIHGFTENLMKNSVKTVVGAYLKRNDHNVIGVDYGVLANDSYMTVVKNAPIVGAGVAMALNEMVNSGFNPEKLHIVGHSMGGQVAGYIGRKVSFQISRITGLDPAGPFFNILEPRLSHSDARFVDIIHTDSGFYGIAKATGTVDFFPNGGRRVQPGCPLNATFYSDAEFCSHGRSWKYYAESVTDESAFFGVQCPSQSRFTTGECNNNTRIIMGYGTSNSAQGNVYLLTAAQSPFGLREKGAEESTQQQN
ncbi:hypothetical protein DMN91_007794 [Ooceraea biroi]|uniref:phospholipase A1 n=1 Tax=Ooceraea biroi TaxID=2015173 RepID=A0A3L8DFK2_OOCBI|nr:hypothetical protein DMN91_007794 [Ooceraea biroi]